jgi:hypothetical protein
MALRSGFARALPLVLSTRGRNGFENLVAGQMFWSLEEGSSFFLESCSCFASIPPAVMFRSKYCQTKHKLSLMGKHYELKGGILLLFLLLPLGA